MHRLVADAGPRPSLFPSPFDELGPHPLARAAAEALQTSLRSGWIAKDLPSALLEAPQAGKMFGVLVVEDDEGRLGYLQAFSGMLAGRWEVDGFVPPVFDALERGAVEPTGERVVKAHHARCEAFRRSPERAALLEEARALEARHALSREKLKAEHEARRERRHAEREKPLSPEERHALDQQSRGDKAEKRKLDAELEAERAALEKRRTGSDRRLAALERIKRLVSRAVMTQLHETYRLTNALGERSALRSLYAPAEPPSGAADCAAPKLLAFAFAQGLRPLALAEFWWGSPPGGGGRLTGSYYPACKDKCGPLLPFLLRGIDTAPARKFTLPAPTSDALRVLYEDAWLVVLDKPSGVLSVPSKDVQNEDSILHHLRRRYPRAQGPLLAHRLDLDTSGLLVAALDSASHAHLQRQFVEREVSKRYVAWVDGRLAADAGTIALPLRVDLDDRPRQIVDPVHGKPALTVWKRLAERNGQTRVAFFPQTGRTHQLRVHAAHPAGLGAPITGDRLYGREAQRLHLHAEALELRHPATGELLRFESPAPF